VGLACLRSRFFCMQAHFLHAGEGVSKSQTWFDPLHPDFERFPRARRATPYVAVCDEGETIFCPSNWFHYAISLTQSITLMRNFFNDANIQPFMSEWTEAQGKKKAVERDDSVYLPPSYVGQPLRHVEGFVASKRFEGAVAECVFKLDVAGLGYYPDANRVPRLNHFKDVHVLSQAVDPTAAVAPRSEPGMPTASSLPVSREASGSRRPAVCVAPVLCCQRHDARRQHWRSSKRGS